MNRLTKISTLLNLYKKFGTEKYTIGEEQTQLSHALLSHKYARDFKHAKPYLCLSALIHDVGHFIYYPFGRPFYMERPPINPLEKDKDDYHEEQGFLFLEQLGFHNDITFPIRNHVLAKRYLCSIDNDYYNSLSEASRASFYLQGGKMGKSQMRNFENNSHFKDSLLLRKADDNSKRLSTENTFEEQLTEFEELLNYYIRDE